MKAGGVTEAVLLAEIDDPRGPFAQLSFGFSLGHEQDARRIDILQPLQDSPDLGEIPSLFHDKLELVVMTFHELFDHRQVQPVPFMHFSELPSCSFPGR